MAVNINPAFLSVHYLKKHFNTVCMPDLRMTFIRNLKHYRKQQRMRQLDLAFAIGKSANYINSVENGKYFPPPETIDQIAVALGIESEQLFVSEFPPRGALEKDSTAAVDLQHLERQLQEAISKDIARIFSELD